MSGEVLAVGRSADGIATEIRVIVQQTRTMMAAAVIEVGKRLIEAQQLVPHGEWGEYVTHSCGFSQRTAQAYMQLAANEANAQTFADLPYSKALALLALPEGAAGEFRESYPVEDMSVRELKMQIADYREQLKAKDSLLTEANGANGELRQRLHDIDADYKTQLDTVDRENGRLRAELEEAKKPPAEISAEEVSALRAEGYAKGVSELAGDKARLEGQLKDQASAHEAALASLVDETREAFARKDSEIAELKAQLTAAAQTPADLRTLVVGSVQDAATAVADNLNRMHGWYLKVKDSDPKLAGAIRRMVEAQISQMYSKFDIDPI